MRESVDSALSLKALFLSMCALPAIAQAGDVEWQGGNTNWFNDTNWIGGTAPGATDNAVFSLSNVTVGLNGGTATVGSITSTGNSTVGINTGTLELSGASITTGTGRMTISTNITLLNNLTVSGTDVRLTGAISDGAGGFGIQANGGGSLRLAGANTFAGGVTQAGGGLYVQHNQALGTGTFTVKAGDTYIGAARIENAIVFSKSDTSALNFRADAGSGNAAFGYQTEFAGAMSGDLNGAGISFRGNAMTWIFSGGVSITNAHAAGLALNPEGIGHHSYIFSTSPSITGAIPGRTVLGGSSGTGHGNLLVNQAITYGGRFIDVNNGGGVDTIGGIHETGTAIFEMTGHADAAIRLYDATAGATNFISQNEGATTRFTAKIIDTPAPGAVAVRINADHQRIDAAASMGQASPVYATHSSEGTVDFASLAGNVYRGGTTVYGGRFLVNNTSNSGTGSGAVLIKSGASLGGAGIIAPEGANGVVLEAGAVLAPGNATIGTLRINAGGVSEGTAALTLNSGATIDMRLGEDGASDRVAIWNYAAGDVVFSGNVVNFTTLSGVTLEAGAEYTLFSFYSDAGTTSVGAVGISDGLVIGTGLEGFEGSYLRYGDGGISLVVVGSSIPEPASFGLWSAVLAGLVACRRRGPARRALV